MIAYLTDIEGMWSKLSSFVERTSCVHFDAGGRLRIDPGATFVFGGDAVDRGPDGRRVVATLLEAKEHAPECVVLLAGNRDINKLRLVRELTGSPPARVPAGLLSDRPALLRWIFENTMGAAGAFDFRREELTREGGVPSDEDVVESFLEDVRVGGPLHRYLRVCQLAFRRGPTLFVHGGVLRENLGVVPGRARTTGVDTWVGALNAFFAEQMGAYERGDVETDGRPAWTPLVAYQAPLPGTRANPESVVYSRPADTFNNPKLPPRDVMRALQDDGVTRVVLGHTPNGDCPSVVRCSADPRFELVIADNSHARHALASSVLLTETTLDVSATVVLDDGTTEPVAYRLEQDDHASPIGRVTADTGHLVQGALSRDRFLLYKALPGYATEHLAIDAATLARRGLTTPDCA